MKRFIKITKEETLLFNIYKRLGNSIRMGSHSLKVDDILLINNQKATLLGGVAETYSVMINEIPAVSYDYVDFFILNTFSIMNGERANQIIKYEDVRAIGKDFLLKYTNEASFNILFMDKILVGLANNLSVTSISTIDGKNKLSKGDKVGSNGTILGFEHDVFSFKVRVKFLKDTKLLKPESVMRFNSKYENKTETITFEDKINKFFNEIKNILSYKNIRYGNSAMEPLNIFNKDNAATGIAVRLDDKLARIKNSEKLRKNDVIDLIGYLSLLSISNDWLDLSDLKD